MNFEDYLTNLPLLHSWDDAKTWNTGGFEREQLYAIFNFLKKNLPSNPKILETGAGNSTICFLFLSPDKLISIAPDRELFNRIQAYCESKKIQTNALEAYIEGSEWVLPELARKVGGNFPELDFALIDGCHNWPMVFLDFFYVNYLLKNGGYLMIDDVQLHSVKELARMLSEQPDFHLELDLGKSLIFRRESDKKSLGEWIDLPYILRKSNEYSQNQNPFAL